MPTIDYKIVGNLPTNIEGERAILRAILLDNSAFNEAAEHLKVGHLSLDSRRRIYARMVDLAESSRPVDMITLIEELERYKDLRPIGDVGDVSSWLDGVSDRPREITVRSYPTYENQGPWSKMQM
jgi:replicative DNA helicase